MADTVAKIVGIANSSDELPGVLQALELRAGAGLEPLLVAGDGAVADGVPKHIPVCLLSEYGPIDDVQKNAVLWLDEWSDAPIMGSPSFKALLAYKEISLWWFLLPVLFPDIMRCMQYIDRYNALFTAEDPEEVVCADLRSRPMLPFRLNRSFDLQTRVAPMVAAGMGIRVTAPSPNWRGAWDFWLAYWGRSATNACYRTLGRRVDRMGRRVISWGARLGHGGNEKPGEVLRKLVLFSTPAYWRREGISAETPGGRDVIAGRVIDEVVGEMGWQVVDIDVEVNVPSFEHYARLWGKARRAEVKCKPLESYLDREVYCAAAKGAQRFAGLWQRLRQDEEFKKSLCYRNVPLWPLLQQRWQYLFCEYAQVALLHIEAAGRIMELERPDAVLIEYEEGSYGRAATVAARNAGVPSVALQHGLHGGGYIPSYYFSKTSWECGGGIDGCPIPTKTAVFGEVTRHYLNKISSYPAAAIAVTGTTIYDDAIDFSATVDQPEIRRQLGCAESGVVTVLSSIFTEAQDRRWFIENTLGAVADRGMQYIVKLHPREEGSAWSEIAARMGVAKPLLLRDRLWPAIAAADVVVSWYSTTILDALLLNRPVVVLRIPGKNNPDNLADSGRIGIVDDRKGLAAALSQFSVSEGQRVGPVERGRQLLEEHLFKCDGQASKRIAALLSEVTETMAPSAQTSGGPIADEEFVHGI